MLEDPVREVKQVAFIDEEPLKLSLTEVPECVEEEQTKAVGHTERSTAKCRRCRKKKVRYKEEGDGGEFQVRARNRKAKRARQSHSLVLSHRASPVSPKNHAGATSATIRRSLTESVCHGSRVR